MKDIEERGEAVLVEHSAHDGELAYLALEPLHRLQRAGNEHGLASETPALYVGEQHVELPVELGPQKRPAAGQEGRLDQEAFAPSPVISHTRSRESGPKASWAAIR